jgi:hypothetical protein
MIMYYHVQLCVLGERLGKIEVANTGPTGFDPATTGFGGLCFAKQEQHPVLTRRRAHKVVLD